MFIQRDDITNRFRFLHLLQMPYSFYYVLDSPAGHCELMGEERKICDFNFNDL